MANRDWPLGRSCGDAKPDGLAATALSVVRAGQPLGLFLSTVPVVIGLVLHLRATYQPLNELWPLGDGSHYAVGVDSTYQYLMVVSG